VSESDRKHWAQSTGDPVEGAPPGVRPISLDALNYLGVSDEGELYWFDTKILTAKRRFELNAWQSIGAVITILAAAVAAGAATVSAYTDYVSLHAKKDVAK
jgi:hypothetical protein